MKIHQATKARTIIPYVKIDVVVDFEGTQEEWEKVKKDILPKIDIS